MGRMSGGITGITSMTIHSGLLPDSRKASTTSSLLMILALFCPEDSFRPVLSSSASSLVMEAKISAKRRKSYPAKKAWAWPTHRFSKEFSPRTRLP